MVTVTLAHPAAEHVTKYPRAYALWVQLTKKGAVPQVAEEAVRTLTGQTLSTLEGSLTFEQFAKEVLNEADCPGNCKTVGLACHDASGKLGPWAFDRRALKDHDVRIQVDNRALHAVPPLVLQMLSRITHCGICHSDLHQIYNEWSNSTYPMVPGHEIVGVVTEVGPGVTKHAVGDYVGVGCMVNSCRSCDACASHVEQFCASCAYTYNGQELDGSPTYGGYSTDIVATEHFVLKLPKNLPLDAAAPLLCAGITVYSPIVDNKLNKAGLKVGVAGLGGLGHMAVKILKAFGCSVVVLSTSPKKKEEAIKVLGADEFLVVKDEDAMQQAAKTLNGIIDTISADHDIRQYISLLKFGGRLVLLGIPPTDYKVAASQLVFGNIKIAGSLIGGIKQTQEMLDFCGKHNITCEIEKIDADYVNTAMERLAKNDVHYRFVIDIQKSLLSG